MSLFALSNNRITNFQTSPNSNLSKLQMSDTNYTRKVQIWRKKVTSRTTISSILEPAIFLVLLNGALVKIDPRYTIPKVSTTTNSIAVDTKLANN